MELLLRCLYILSSPDGSKPAGVDSSKAGLARPDASLNVPPASSHPTSRRKCAASKSPWFLIQDKKKNKKPKSRRDHRSYRLRHLFHFPPSIILHGRPPPQRSAPPPVVRSRRPVKEVYLERCLIFLLFLCNLRSLFFFHFHLILACAFFHGLDLCAMVTVLLLPSRESRVEREKKKVSFHLMADRKTGGSPAGNGVEGSAGAAAGP